MMTCNDGNMQEIYFVLFKTGTWHQVEKSWAPWLHIAVATFFLCWSFWILSVSQTIYCHW